jgi:nicotinamide-nucleotide amidase
MEILEEMLSDIAVGFEGETSIAELIGKILTEKGMTYSVAESCTGGRIASEITQYAGASSAFMGGIIPYDTGLKTKILGVPKNIIEQYNVVSIPVAEEMAKRCCKLFESDYSIATTGIAGPTKGDGEDEVGTVCIAIGTPNGVVSEKFSFGNDRYRVIEKAANKALEMLLKEISKN